MELKQEKKIKESMRTFEAILDKNVHIFLKHQKILNKRQDMEKEQNFKLNNDNDNEQSK